ncbi:hypothetical protein IP69_01275 [Bosea sp. AAP35]|uniref:hypothetical protein n=1 Tax=Bosea sp. AAP35 TaxID=1523417 RepID=UPI0006B8D180|nr:hypothetical protein [Bosea sp. AAP35]KPF72563.1 hypothetical protein IP69_01275 [Bosea sp. AAP35]
MIRSVFLRLNAIASSAWRVLLETQIARLAIFAVKLWPRSRLLSLLLALLALGCVALAGWSAHQVFGILVPASPISAWIAAALTALVVLALCAFTAIAGIEALLQLAYDFGRHRVGVLLALATILAVLAAVEALPGATELATADWLALGLAAVLLMMAGWFQRTYRTPARRGFRDFHVDVVEARQVLARAAHGV